MSPLFKNIRPIVFAIAAAIALGIFVYSSLTINSSRLLIVRLTQLYALTAVSFLYIALLASPLMIAFPRLPFRALYIRARKAIGVSAFFFGLLHGSIAFFLQLGGFPGLLFLSQDYIIAITLSATALLILSIMALTSLSYFIMRLGRNWKRIHRLVYIAGILIIIHALMLGSHFSDLSGTIPQIFSGALVFLLVLEAYRFSGWLLPGKRMIPFAVLSILIAILVYKTEPYMKKDSAINIHSQHTGAQAVNSSEDFKVVITSPSSFTPGQEIPLEFRIEDKQNRPVTRLQTQLEQKVHIIIVDKNLQYFRHTHPVQQGATFKVTQNFPEDGIYYMYFNYYPVLKAEQVSVVTVTVGSGESETQEVPTDLSRVKKVSDYTISITSPERLEAVAMQRGSQAIIFEITQNGKPVTDLSTYLGSFGHLIMIRRDTYDYLHVHPVQVPQGKDDKSGPSVIFRPVSLGKSIKPGVYRMFAEFKHNGRIIMVDYTVQVN